MQLWTTVVVCYIVQQTTTAVDPSCECLLFNGFDGYLMNGSFSSPDYPVLYEPRIHCLLYTFVGRQNEFVSITFHDFQLSEPDKSGKCSDFLRLFQELDAPNVNEETLWQEELCGHRLPFTVYSKHYALIMEFHTDSVRGPNDRGFIGEFKFHNRKEFLTDGSKDPGTLCDYYVQHKYPEPNVGKLVSPDYPYFFPPLVSCHYWLSGEPRERIQFTIKALDLAESHNNCLDEDEYILIYDGQWAQFTNPYTNRRQNTSKLARFCSQSIVPDVVVSSGPYAFVEFRGKRKGMGFVIEYEFIEKAVAPTVEPEWPWPFTTPASYFYMLQHQLLLSATAPYHAMIYSIFLLYMSVSQHVSAASGVPCDVDITSDDGPKQGNFTSPLYGVQTYPHPVSLRCTYRFHTKGSERVQIIFTKFHLAKTYQPYEDERKPTCRQTDDRVTIYVDTPEKTLLNIRTFCGAVTPPRTMSSRNFLQVEYVSNLNQNGPSSNPDMGYNFTWKFVTNFGIISGEQLESEVCSFLFNSSVTNNGTITSPNSPGYYPRNTDCVYLFNGAADEKVVLQFTYFDVEGTDSCNNDSMSDYIEFSNYKTADRKIPRYCGKKKPTKMESDANYYRMIFHSNGVFDGRGFSAMYQFTKKEAKAAIKSVRSSTSEASSSSRIAISILLTALIITLLRVGSTSA